MDHFTRLKRLLFPALLLTEAQEHHLEAEQIRRAEVESLKSRLLADADSLEAKLDSITQALGKV